MTEKQAIIASIEHWKENLDNCILLQLEPELFELLCIDIRCSSCALCDIYFNYGCHCCPIAEKVRCGECYETPYRTIEATKNEFEDTREVSILPKLQKSIEDELKLLYSLLDNCLQ